MSQILLKQLVGCFKALQSLKVGWLTVQPFGFCFVPSPQKLTFILKHLGHFTELDIKHSYQNSFSLFELRVNSAAKMNGAKSMDYLGLPPWPGQVQNRLTTWCLEQMQKMTSVKSQLPQAPRATNSSAFSKASAKRLFHARNPGGFTYGFRNYLGGIWSLCFNARALIQ